MCRSIKTLRGMEPAASDEDVRAAALQYVRKISGYRKPSRVNQATFDTAVAEIAAVSMQLLEGLTISSPSTRTSTVLGPTAVLESA